MKFWLWAYLIVTVIATVIVTAYCLLAAVAHPDPILNICAALNFLWFLVAVRNLHSYYREENR